jgi:hypothetical protein
MGAQIEAKAPEIKRLGGNPPSVGETRSAALLGTSRAARDAAARLGERAERLVPHAPIPLTVHALPGLALSLVALLRAFLHGLADAA